MRSCSSQVLMEETAEPVVSAHCALPVLGYGHHIGKWIRRFQLKRPVRAMLVAGSARGAVLAFTEPVSPDRPPNPRAGHPGTGLSTRPVTNKRLRCRSAPQYPGWTARSVAGIHRQLLPYRPATAASLCPSPCARRSRARTTTGTPPRPAPTADDAPAHHPKVGRAATWSLPTFTTTRSTRSGRVAGAHCCAPAP
jgi:hypothetical protein